MVGPILFSVLAVLAMLLTATSLLQHPIEQVVRSRYPAFHYDGQGMLVWGIVMLGAVTMLSFLLIALKRL